jgi:hypothetical protein
MDVWLLRSIDIAGDAWFLPTGSTIQVYHFNFWISGTFGWWPFLVILKPFPIAHPYQFLSWKYKLILEGPKLCYTTIGQEEKLISLWENSVGTRTNCCDTFGESWPVSEASLTNLLNMSTEFAFMGERLHGSVSPWWDWKAGHHGFSVQLLILVYEECIKYRQNLFHYAKKAKWCQSFGELPQHGLPLEQSFVNNINSWAMICLLAT